MTNAVDGICIGILLIFYLCTVVALRWIRMGGHPVSAHFPREFAMANSVCGQKSSEGVSVPAKCGHAACSWIYNSVF